jgi:hypothetical protein
MSRWSWGASSRRCAGSAGIGLASAFDYSRLKPEYSESLQSVA